LDGREEKGEFPKKSHQSGRRGKFEATRRKKQFRIEKDFQAVDLQIKGRFFVTKNFEQKDCDIKTKEY